MNTETIRDKHLDIPIEDGIYLRRDPDGQIWTNVPHLVIHHSPTGFEWGHGGSGPADLALNIAEAIFQRLDWHGERMECRDGECYVAARDVHQELKRKFIATVDRNAGRIIPYEELRAWIVARIPKVLAKAWTSAWDEVALRTDQTDDDPTGRVSDRYPGYNSFRRNTMTTICTRCGTEIGVTDAHYAGSELPTWEGATLCSACYAAELTPTATDLSEPEVLDPDMGPGWRVLVWRDNTTWKWYTLAENDADPKSGMPVVIAVEQEFNRRYDAINAALRTIRTYLEN